jgi:hypothetical protein
LQKYSGYTPGNTISTSTSNAAIPRFTVLSTRTTGTTSHIVLQRNKEIRIVIVNGDENIACSSTVGTIRSVTSTVHALSDFATTMQNINLLATPSTILAVFSIAMFGRVSAVSSPATSLAVLSSTASTTITTFRIQAQLFVSGNFP